MTSRNPARIRCCKCRIRMMKTIAQDFKYERNITKSYLQTYILNLQHFSRISYQIYLYISPPEEMHCISHQFHALSWAFFQHTHFHKKIHRWGLILSKSAWWEIEGRHIVLYYVAEIIGIGFVMKLGWIVSDLCDIQVHFSHVIFQQLVVTHKELSFSFRI